MIALLNGDSGFVPLADESVHCIVMSPPYYNLRKYPDPSGKMVRVWGGSSDCAHDWDVSTRHMQTGGESEKQKSNQGVNGSGWSTTESTCRLCGAWRGELGLESTVEQYVKNMEAVGRECWRILRPEGTLWVVIADTYAGSGGAGGDYNPGGRREGQPRWKSGFKPTGEIKPKDLMGIPWEIARAFRAMGFYWRREIIWWKPNPMPSSAADRPTTAHEYIFLFSKSRRYFYDEYAIREPVVSGASDIKKMMQGRKRIYAKHQTVRDELHSANHRTNIEKKRAVGNPLAGRNKRSVWELQPDWDGFVEYMGEQKIDLLAHWSEYMQAAGRNPDSVWHLTTSRYEGAHFATYPPQLVTVPILAGTSAHGVCADCGEPWRRIIQKPDMQERPVRGAGSKWNPENGEFLKSNWGDSPQSQGWQYQEWREQNPDVMVGWQPGCDCGVEWGVRGSRVVPAVVFDPFVGSGTTIEKARELGRNGIGLDLSFSYLQHNAMSRLGLAQMRAWIEGEPLDGTPRGGHKNLQQETRVERDRQKQRNNPHGIHRARAAAGDDDEQLRMF